MTSSTVLSPAITPAMMANPMIAAKTPLAPQTPVPLGIKYSPPVQGEPPASEAPVGKHVDMLA